MGSPPKIRTTYLAKLIGLYILIVGIVAATQKEEWIGTITQLTHSAPLMLLLGLIALAAGLAIVIGHNVWHGGALPVIVTLIGWLSALKGAGFLLLSLTGHELLMTDLDYSGLFFVYVGIDIALGAYLAYCGFTSQTRASRTPA